MISGLRCAFGRLLSQTYPSGRKVAFNCNLDGDISSIWGTTAAGQNRLYLNGITYNAAGQMTRLRLGNGKWESTEYNDRLQVTEIGLGNSAGDRSTLKLEYGYGDETQNNGSLRSQKITFAGLTTAYDQTYTYDDLNRLKSAEEKIGTTTNWKQTFNYDRFGNRTFDAANTTTISVSNTVTNPSASTSTNRLNGHTYDPAGNLTVDAENKRFVYDAENHQTKLFGTANNSETPDAIYQYDGEGRRVRKISSTETTVFVYDGSGQLVAEYTALTGNDPAPAAQVSYLTADHLGSPRVVTNQNGEVIKRSDWMAFGEEVEFNKRTAGLGYDEVPETRKGYTGYEKDEESGLDFAQARYYNPKHGRYTSVDPLTASANVKNPQTFNRYSYVLNSPYKFSDPLGLIAENTGAYGSAGQCDASYSSCYDSSNSGGFADPTEEPAAESQTASAGEPLVSNEGGYDEQQAAPPVSPPTASEQNAESEIVGETAEESSSFDDEKPWLGRKVIVLYGQPGTERPVGQNFQRAAQTIAADIVTLGGEVVGSPREISTVSALQNVLEEAGRLGVTDIFIFTHGQSNAILLGDGAVDSSNSVTKSSITELRKRSDSLQAIHLYACNTASGSNSIAQQLADRLNVTVAASPVGMGFSNDSRTRPKPGQFPSTGPTYMVPESKRMVILNPR